MSMKKMLAVVAAASLVAVAAPAFAANPFSDVPMNHWAYDAVEQMAAKGILEGYPNGTFKGNRAMTRYEIAQMVARMMANGVGGADADKLKALIVEFAPELEALGVKVDGFDGRLSKLEKGVGGIRIWGQTRFDFGSTKHKDDHGVETRGHGFEFHRARLFMHRDLSDKVSFDFRWHGGQFDRWWATAKDFLGAQGLTFRAGAFYVDWEGPDNMYDSNDMWDDDGLFVDGTVRGVNLTYNRGGFTFDALAGSDYGNDIYKKTTGDEMYGLRLKYETPKFWLSVNGLHFNGTGKGETVRYVDGTVDIDGTTYDKVAEKYRGKDNDTNFKVYWASLGFRFFNGVTLNGAFWKEDIDSIGKVTPKDDDPKAYKIVLGIDQSVLKFTNLRAEYGKMDKGFYVYNGSGWMSWGPYNANDATGTIAEDTKFLKISAVQKWGKKFSTYERYAHMDQDDNGKAKELQFGIGYAYSPNLKFYVDYTKLDGSMSKGKVNDKTEDKVIRFRTVLNF